METITRAQAIEEFGRHISLSSYNMPPYSYSEPIRETQLKMAIENMMHPNRSNLITLEEDFGRPSEFARKGEWPSFFDQIFAETGKITNKDLSDLVRRHVIAVFDEARQSFENSRETPKGIFARFAKSPEPLPEGRDVFRDLSVHVKYLPSEIQVPSQRLKAGDTVFQLLDHYLREKGTRIVEHKVTDLRLSKKQDIFPKHGAKCTCDFDVVRRSDVYEITYTVKSSDKAMPIHFQIDEDGRFSHLTRGDCFSPGGHFFLNRSDAELKEAEIWTQVDAQSQKYHQRKNIPA